MYRTMNTRLVKSQLPVQARLLSTHQQQVRKGGMSKVLLGTLFVTAAGFAYYANTSTTDQRKSIMYIPSMSHVFNIL